MTIHIVNSLSFVLSMRRWHSNEAVFIIMKAFMHAWRTCLMNMPVHHACCLKYSLGGSAFGEGVRFRLAGKSAISEFKDCCFKVERKVQSIFLPVIHQDCRLNGCFKVKRKVLLCFAGFADYGQKMILPSCMILLNFTNGIYQRNSSIQFFPQSEPH